MKDSEIHVGDVLRIKEWDDMVAEYGVDKEGDIKIPGDALSIWFMGKNKDMCGRIFTVRAKMHGVYNMFYYSEENVEYDPEARRQYIITCNMLEPFTGDEYELATDEDISMLFG